MAPIHDGWKDDAEFLRYNREPEKKWWHPIANFIGGCAIVAVCISAVGGAIFMGASQGNADCWRGTARSYDCGMGCGANPELIDVELDYARRHPQCQADWDEAKRREAERYWRYKDTLAQAQKIMDGAQ
jgi:hypothetical protein